MTDSSFGWNIIKKPEYAEVRKTTNRLIEMAEDGAISWEDIARTALNWLSEDDVNHMARVNEFLPDEEEDDRDEN